MRQIDMCQEKASTSISEILISCRSLAIRSPPILKLRGPNHPIEQFNAFHKII